MSADGCSRCGAGSTSRRRACCRCSRRCRAGFAQAGGNASLPLLIGQGAGGTSYSVPIQTLLFFTALSFLPAVLLLMTGFTRIVIVLSCCARRSARRPRRRTR